jgi:YVTN family beta-propeller protein
MNRSRAFATTAAASVAIACAAANAAEFVYVAAWIDDAVMVIDTSNDAVLTSIPVADGPAGIAADAAGGQVYVGSTGSNSVSVISVATNSVIGTIPVGLSPMAMAFSAAKRRLYVADSEGVAVIDANSESVVDRIAGVTASQFCDSVALNHAGDRLYVVGQGDLGGRIWVIDTANDEILHTIPTFQHPCSATVAPDDSVVLVTPGDSLYNYLSIQRLQASDDSVDSLLIAGNAWDSCVAFSWDGQLLYLPVGWGLLRVFDLSTGSLQGSTALAPPFMQYPGPAYVYGMAMSRDSSRLYVADSASNTVSVVDIAHETYLHAVTVGFFPNGLAIVSTGDAVYKNGFELDSGSSH